jgi:Mlc titration factor MtfA (ptsG expression regulator)
MNLNNWTEELSGVYARLQYQVSVNSRTAIDPYAAVSPAEFFAVISETFFETPALLNHHYPELYKELNRFYRQDPLSWEKSIDRE